MGFSVPSLLLSPPLRIPRRAPSHHRIIAVVAIPHRSPRLWSTPGTPMVEPTRNLRNFPARFVFPRRLHAPGAPAHTGGVAAAIACQLRDHHASRQWVRRVGQPRRIRRHAHPHQGPDYFQLSFRSAKPCCSWARFTPHSTFIKTLSPRKAFSTWAFLRHVPDPPTEPFRKKIMKIFPLCFDSFPGPGSAVTSHTYTVAHPTHHPTHQCVGGCGRVCEFLISVYRF